MTSIPKQLTDLSPTPTRTQSPATTTDAGAVPGHTHPAPSPRHEGLRRVGVALDAAVIALALAGAAFHILNRHTSAPGVQTFRAQELVASLAFAVGGIVILRQSNTGLLGWTVSGVGVTQGIAYACAEYGIYALGTAPQTHLPFGPTAVWLSVWVGQIGYWLIAVTLLLLPDGRLRSPSWRVAAVAAAVALLLSAAGWALDPYRSLDSPIRFAHLTNPVAAPAAVAGTLLAVGGLLGGAAVVASLVCVVMRFRSSTGVERQQLKWVLAAAGATVALMAASLAAGSGRLGDVLLALAFLPLPAGVAVAVIRYRLWDVDVVVNRALLYGILTAGIVLVYAAVVVTLGGAIGRRFGAPLLATIVVALGVQPARVRLQRWTDRLLYGSRGEPYAALTGLAQLLQGAAGQSGVLDGAAETIARSLRVPSVDVVVVDGNVVSSFGVQPTSAETFPMTSNGLPVGELVVGRRPGESTFSPRDRRLLGDLARQVAAAVRNMRLAQDVQRSREQLVSAREEERRRIRRDLHDELGPQLAGTALQLDQVVMLVDRDPGAARQLVSELSARLRRMVVDVRQLVHGLRPPALDELGLEEALRDQVRRLDSPETSVELDATMALRPLPAAVEVAAYRIVSEALVNAVRHSGAHRCTVTLAGHDALIVTVEDDGRGIAADARPGVGLRSMHERAEELGGTCDIGPRHGGGTIVRAVLPVAS